MSPSPADPADATLLSNAAAAGDKAAADQLLPLVYDQLRKAAQLKLAGERGGQSLSATGLVHEAYLKLIGPRAIPWAGRGHFYAAAVEAMRRILVDRARARGRRGGRALNLTEIGDVMDLADADPKKSWRSTRPFGAWRRKTRKRRPSCGFVFTRVSASTRPRRFSGRRRGRPRVFGRTPAPCFIEVSPDLSSNESPCPTINDGKRGAFSWKRPISPSRSAPPSSNVCAKATRNCAPKSTRC